MLMSVDDGFIARAKSWWKHILAVGGTLVAALTILVAVKGDLTTLTNPIIQMFSGPSSVPKITIRDAQVTGPTYVGNGSPLLRVNLNFVVEKDGGPELQCDLEFETKGTVVSGDTRVKLQKGARQEQIDTSVTLQNGRIAKKSSFRLQCPNIITTWNSIILDFTEM
jgi:hypothetical protein